MDTIAAISTPIGNGGIGIIRISGDKSLEIIKKIFKTAKEEYLPNTIVYGKIVENSEFIDEALVSFFKAPLSYTGEDVIEINCHGGMIVLDRILDLVLKNGAKLAEPGEFTKRAFLNGKMDLTQAESVMDIINSKSELENKNSARILNGELGNRIKNVKSNVLDVVVDLEANVDYPEYDIEQISRDKVVNTLEQAIEDLKNLSNTFNEGKIIKEGINIAIVGKPNVGKSSLLNRLLKEERAIVTDVAGTTRDTIKESIIYKGITLNLVDTAGIHETDDLVENIGVNKSINAIREADLVLMVIDNSSNIDEEDFDILKKLENKNKYFIINKVDVNCDKRLDIDNYVKNDKCFYVSARENIGINEMLDSIISDYKMDNLKTNSEVVISNKRHKEAIDKTISSFENALNNAKLQVPLDMLSIEIQNGIDCLNEILGSNVNEEIIDGIFKKFCLGK